MELVDLGSCMLACVFFENSQALLMFVVLVSGRHGDGTASEGCTSNQSCCMVSGSLVGGEKMGIQGYPSMPPLPKK